MAFLPKLIGIQAAAPLVALIAMTIELILTIRYHHSLNLRTLWRLVLASTLGIPIGIWALKQINENVLLLVLGVVISRYAIYALFDFKLPELRHPSWIYGTG
jgi:uncharacterized membrane protein YfcA